MEYYPFIGLIFTLLYIIYEVSAKSLVGEKKVYISYTLLVLGVLWLANIVLNCIYSNEQSSIPTIILLLAVPVACALHYIYPFKGKRNKQVSFLLTATSLIEICIIGGTWLLVQFSNM